VNATGTATDRDHGKVIYQTSSRIWIIEEAIAPCTRPGSPGLVHPTSEGLSGHEELLQGPPAGTTRHGGAAT